MKLSSHEYDRPSQFATISLLAHRCQASSLIGGKANSSNTAPEDAMTKTETTVLLTTVGLLTAEVAVLLWVLV